ncbi:hypothetical protein QQS21_012169 [Conoideocrella luteorostrata]|uniref:DUF7598 domain-containing protein n=1 Tax=Conoideocrella luteorostrata TaxID=1105319 RepID=A0AAJ0FSY8_9HYPO|nr:hypothetical protein QQS21_012169 [Conoideocrella luteorostrata]
MIWMLVFKFFKPAAVKGAGMVILQILRIFTMVTLAAIAASCWVLIIKVDKGRSYFVFECASLCFTSFISVFLLVSEWPPHKSIRNYYRQSWPVFSDYHGLTWLGTALLMIGCNILGNLNKPANDKENLGPHFSKLVLASAILAITFGLLNIIGALVWRDGKEGINSRDIRSSGSLAKSRRQSLPDYSSSAGSSYYQKEKPQKALFSMLWGKKKDNGEKTPARPYISGPIQTHKDVERDGGHGDRQSPVVPGLRRPDTALHPMHDRNSNYSAAHMSRI